jgi:hypothetical protein
LVKLFHKGLHIFTKRAILLDTFPDKGENMVYIDLLLTDIRVFGVLFLG